MTLSDDRLGMAASPRFPNDVNYIQMMQDRAVPITPEYICTQSAMMIESSYDTIEHCQRLRRLHPDYSKQMDEAVDNELVSIAALTVIYDRARKSLQGVKP